MVLAMEYEGEGDVQTFEEYIIYIYIDHTNVRGRFTSKNKEFGGAMHPETLDGECLRRRRTTVGSHSTTNQLTRSLILLASCIPRSRLAFPIGGWQGSKFGPAIAI